MFVLAGRASAAEAPTVALSVLKDSQPPPDRSILATLPTATDAPSKEATANKTPATPSDTDRPTPEISIEISAAEYVPPPPAPKPQPVVRVVANVGSVPGNHFPYGYCTWYVASRRYVPWTGNAGVWYAEAQAYGFAVGQAPRAGAIMVTAESYLGHVAYVESVNADGSWTVSEMNYAGFGVISSRTIHPGQIPLIGFIY
jgi:surface antigen